MASWLGTFVLIFFMIFAGWMAVSHGVMLLYVGCALLAAATVLIFPPLRRSSSRRWRIVRVGTALALAATALLIPVPTHAVKLDMPVSSSASNH